MTWFQIQQSKSLSATGRDIGEKAVPLSERKGWPSDDWCDNWKVSVYRFWNILTIYLVINLTTNCAHVMVNLYGRRSICRPSLIYICSGLTTGRGYYTVSMWYLYDLTRLRTDSAVLFEIICWGGPGLGTSCWKSNLRLVSGNSWVTNLCKFYGL